MKQEFEFKVSGKEWETLQDSAFVKVNKDAKIDGFRPGKAPRSMYEKKYGKQEILFEAADMAIKKEYERLLTKEKVMPVIEPKVDLVKCDEKELSVKFVFVLEPKVELGKYTNLGVKQEKAKVTKEEIEHRIKHLREDYAEVVVKEEDKIADGDIAIIDFKGTKDGVAFDGGTAENYSLTVGSKTFIPGFEEAMIGMKRGEEKDIKLTFPEDYMAEELKGQKVVFHVKVNEIKTRVVPKLDKEFFEDLGMDGIDSKEALEAQVKENITAQKDKEADDKYIDALLAKIAENTEIDVPDTMINDETDRMVDSFAEHITMQGITIEQFYKFTNSTKETLKEQYKEEATKRIKYRLILEAIIKAEKITVSDKEVDEKLEEIATKYNMTKEEVKKQYGENIDYIKYDLEVNKAFDIIKGE